jgi:lipopolysaccharide transport system permease protein
MKQTAGLERSIIWSAADDWYRGTLNVRLWTSLAWYDTVLRYRRSILGPFWITLTMAALLIGMGPLYSALFNIPLSKFFPHLAIGMIVWSFLSTCITEGCTVFIAASRYLKHSDFPGSIFIWRSLCRNVIQLGHHLPLLVPIAIWAKIPPSFVMLLFPFSFLVVLINLHAIQVIVGLLCARYRDGTPLIASMLQFLFFLTPIFWLPETLPKRASFVLYNPLATLLESIRQPLMGSMPTLQHWFYLAGITAITTTLAAVLYATKRRWVAYWI